MIAFRGITKRFGRLEVLRGVDLELSKGRVMALVGPNATGKTTLVKMLLGLAFPDSGEIEFDGHVLDGDADYRSRIGYMPQIARFPENVTGAELLAVVDKLRGAAIRDDDLLTSLHLEGELGKPLRTLSGGTRQKVNAVIAFRYRPDLLILDEPTSGLDPLSARILKQKVLDERARGCTVLITSHVMSELDELADDIAFLVEGTVRYAGAVHDLKHRTHEATLERALATLMAARLVA